MAFKQIAFTSAVSSIILCSISIAATAATQDNAASSVKARSLPEVVVTAQKISQNINDVGMSIQSTSGSDLQKLGITNTNELVKIVPGFNYTPSFYGTPQYTMRGVGFQTTSLAASPTVSVYVDQFPLPYSIMTTGASLDAQRVEVLKGPQGTLYGENSTGGLINYIANKPTDDWEAGYNASYSRFNTVDLTGYVSGPITDGLSFRVAARTLFGNDWQYSYTHPASAGQKKLTEYRASLQWEPNDRFSALFTASGFQDRGDTQMPQLFGIAVLSPASGLDPRIFNYPVAPHDPRAADWSACVNTSGFNPPFGTAPIDQPHPITATTCQRAKNDSSMWRGALRMDYHFDSGITLTSLTEYANFTRHGSAIEGDGTIYQDYESVQRGYIHTIYQELRVSGNWFGAGHWMAGINYEQDATWDHFLQSYQGATANPLAIPGASLCSIPGFCTGVNLTGVPDFYLNYMGPSEPVDLQKTKAYAGFVNADYPILENLTLQAGARFTQTNKSFHGCGNDSGDGAWARNSQGLQNLLEVLSGTISPATYLQPGNWPGGNGIDVGPGQCGTTGPGPDFHPYYFTSTLNENNVSWRVGVDWHAWEGTLLYFNVSQGYKSGAYPTVATSTSPQLSPATQESLLAYEVGFKSTLLSSTLQLNGAIYYYDYKDKQLLGALVDPVFGALPKLINVPKSHIAGFELSANWLPIDRLTVRPSVSYVYSRVDGCDGSGPNCIDGDYYNFDPFSQYFKLTGEAFPTAPKWQANIDAQYQWPIGNGMTAFVGTNVNYQGGTDGAFYNPAVFPANNAQPPHILYIKPHTLVDLRLGVEHGSWRVQLWGHNIFNKYYWTSAAHVNDVLVRYAGMPATFGMTVSNHF